MINFYKGKRVFITGHTGFKGAWLSHILNFMGAKIIGYALPPDTKPNLFELASVSNCVDNIFSDIRDLPTLKQAVKSSKCEIIIHLAAQALVRKAYNNPVETYEVNMMGTVNILEAARENPNIKSILIVTTDKVYKNLEIERGYKETDELNGTDPYSNSKSCAELITESYKQSFFKDLQAAVSTARSGNVIGGGDFAADRIIPDAVRALQTEAPLILRYPNSIRPYQFVLEALSAYLLIAYKQYENKSLQGNYNVGPNIADCVKTRELINLFYSHFDGAKWDIQNNNEPYESGLLKLDASKIKRLLGWKPHIDIKQAVEMTAKWTKAYLNKENFNYIMDEQINNYLRGVLK
ncbi:MAG: CDP-glucose 4,6-dehydratase [Elusimicrobiota bacterium]|jgi:CDP-glucose 4,6-dehydratase|nr:CDP-glucose 4,6-dehydratase [Elusimicrobiota bacterium]